jgi:hypothetical protein
LQVLSLRVPATLTGGSGFRVSGEVVYSTSNWDMFRAELAAEREYRVTLKVTGLHGTRNSATVFVRAKEREKLTVDFIASTTQPKPRQEVRSMGRCNGQGATFAWFTEAAHCRMPECRRGVTARLSQWVRP